MRRTILILGFLAGIFWGMGRCLDEHGLLASLMFYLPAPLVVLALLLVAGLLRQKKWLRLGVVLLALWPLMVLVTENRWTARPAASPETSGPTLSVLHWNVCRGWAGWPRLAGRIRDEAPELVILSEVQKRAHAEILAGLLPELPHTRYAVPMLVLSKYPLGEVRVLASKTGLRVYELELHQEEVPWRFVVLDVGANFELAREPLMKTLRSRLEERQPDFLAGDFNTPRKSRLLSPLAPGFVHAYDQAGQGWSYTWPTFLPVLAIDHLFVQPERVEVERYEIESSLWSDHRLQKAILNRQPAKTPSGG